MPESKSTDRLVLLLWPSKSEIVLVRDWNWSLLDTAYRDPHAPIDLSSLGRAIDQYTEMDRVSLLWTHAFVDYAGRFPLSRMEVALHWSQNLPKFAAADMRADRVGNTGDHIFFQAWKYIQEGMGARVWRSSHALTTLIRGRMAVPSHVPQWIWYKVGTQFFSVIVSSIATLWYNHYIVDDRELEYLVHSDLYRWTFDPRGIEIVLAGDWESSLVPEIAKMATDMGAIFLPESHSPLHLVRQSTVLCV